MGDDDDDELGVEEDMVGVRVDDRTQIGFALLSLVFYHADNRFCHVCHVSSTFPAIDDGHIYENYRAIGATGVTDHS